MGEVWRPIEGLEGYEISSHGRVKSLEKTWYSGRGNSKREYKPETIMKAAVSKGTLQVPIRGRRYNVARLVALAFIPNPESKEYVDHIDGDVENNHVGNLRWATNQENQMNRGVMATNSSGYPNAYFVNGKYRSRVKVDGVTRSLGTYATAEEAYTVALEFKRQRYGDFVRLVN